MSFFDKDTTRKRKSLLFKDQSVFMDSKRRTTGTSRKSFFFPKETIYYDKEHKKVGYSRPSYLLPNETIYFDEHGKKIGKSRKSFFNNREEVYFDASGKKIGTSRESFFFKDEEVFRRKNQKSLKVFKMKRQNLSFLLVPVFLHLLQKIFLQRVDIIIAYDRISFTIWAYCRISSVFFFDPVSDPVDHEDPFTVKTSAADTSQH